MAQGNQMTASILDIEFGQMFNYDRTAINKRLQKAAIALESLPNNKTVYLGYCKQLEASWSIVADNYDIAQSWNSIIKFVLEKREGFCKIYHKNKKFNFWKGSDLIIFQAMTIPDAWKKSQALAGYLVGKEILGISNMSSIYCVFHELVHWMQDMLKVTHTESVDELERRARDIGFMMGVDFLDYTYFPQRAGAIDGLFMFYQEDCIRNGGNPGDIFSKLQPTKTFKL